MGIKGRGPFCFWRIFTKVIRQWPADRDEDDEVERRRSRPAWPSRRTARTRPTQPLELDVQVTSPSACERHVTVTISRADIDRYFDDAFGEMMPTAAVPGFRIGRAPRKVVENRFRDEVSDQVKSSLLLDSLEQISEEQRFTAISEPNFDLEAVEVPNDGPMTFEFTIEVRPEFDLPKWKGLKLKRPVREFTDADIDEQLEQMLSRYGQLVPHDGAAAEGDYVSVNITATADGKQVARENEAVVRIRPTLSFRDARLEGFAKLMKGAKAGDTPHGRGDAHARTRRTPSCAARRSTLEFEVLDVKKLKLPELTADFLQEIGGFDDRRRAARRDSQESAAAAGIPAAAAIARSQISALLTKSADWELPPGLLERQSARELERAVMELRRSGFSEAEIRARENQLRQNSTASHGHGPQGALHPGADRRGGEDRRRRGRLREGNLPDRRAERRVAAARAGPARKTRPDGRAAEPDHRAQGARARAVGGQVQGRAVRAAKDRHRGDFDGGRRRPAGRDPRHHRGGGSGDEDNPGPRDGAWIDRSLK